MLRSRTNLPDYWLCSFFALLLMLVGIGGNAIAQTTEDAALPPYKFGVLVSSASDRCYNPGLIKATREFSAQEVAALNAAGGIHGRKIVLELLDDFEDKTKTLEFLMSSIEDPDMIGFVGIGSSTRGYFVFDLLGGPHVHQSSTCWA